MSNWDATMTANTGGYHRILATKPGGTPVDITFLRNAPVGLPSYSTADPFGDSVAQLAFPQLGVWDDLSSPELDWLNEDTSIDIWWIPAYPKPAGWPTTDSGDTALWINPLTNKRDLVAPAFVYAASGGSWVRTSVHRGIKVWEGFIASLDVSQEEATSTITASCQGALFQVDLTLAKPFFPSRPQTVESLILDSFDHTVNPSLRTSPAQIAWPPTWSLLAPAFAGTSNVFSPNVSPGKKWTGYTTRQTGSWDHTLTSFIQNMLAVMLVKPGSGTGAPGDQWTLRNMVQGDAAYPAGRTPVLSVRSRDVAPAFSIWVGTPGVVLNLTRDATQKENVLYGTGTDLAGTTWRNAVISSASGRTAYRPLAASPLAYPPQGNPHLDPGRFVRESYVQYGAGFSQLDAIASAEQALHRDFDPGWAGSITLRTDPSDTLSRWALRAGMTMVLKGFLGTGETGLRVHIASVECSPADGSVHLTVDTRYRDLITLNEAIARTRDALTPAKLLMLNRNSVTIEDIQAPWDYSAGSGYVPKGGRTLYAHKPVTTTFPYLSWTHAHPPKSNAACYVTCHANNPKSKLRWAGPVPILMSEKGTIRRTEFFMVDRNGDLVLKRFHVSLYYNSGIDASFMPNDGRTWSPFIPGAFQSIDPTTGEPWAVPGRAPDGSMVMGWGNADQPAGYSPGSLTSGTKPTGLLVDENSWTFDCSANNPNYDHLAKAGKEAKSVITVFAMFYAEHLTAVYFSGRLYREEPGSVG